jgi:hypothetical protein
MMAETPTRYAVFLRGQNEPVAVFLDGDLAARWGRDTHGDAAVMVPLEGDDHRAAARTARDAFPEPAPAATGSGTTDDPDAALRSEIKARLFEEARRERIEAEVKHEVDDALKAMRTPRYARSDAAPAAATEAESPRQAPRVAAARER